MKNGPISRDMYINYYIYSGAPELKGNTYYFDIKVYGWYEEAYVPYNPLEPEAIIEEKSETQNYEDKNNSSGNKTGNNAGQPSKKYCSEIYYTAYISYTYDGKNGMVMLWECMEVLAL